MMHKKQIGSFSHHCVCARTGAMAGPRIPTDVKPNQFVEANGYAREVVERTFRFSPKNLGKFAIFGIAVPALIYKGCVQEFVSAPQSRMCPPGSPIDRRLGRSERPRATHRSRTLVWTRSASPPGAFHVPARASPRGKEGGTLITRFSTLSSLLWGPKPSTD